LLATLDETFGEPDWPAVVASSEWRTETWAGVRRMVEPRHSRQALRVAYDLLKRPIGPVSFRELAFVTNLLTDDERDYAASVADLVAFAQETNGVSLSGGRYGRDPENIYIAP